MTFEIDDDVPLSSAHRRKYPYRDLRIGQSFFVPDATHQLISGSMHPAKKRLGRKFTARTVTENGVKGVRVWRVA